MSLTAAASRFIVFLLSVSVTQCQNDWKVSYSPTEICALEGSTVKISCTYSYPSRVDGHNITVERAFWFTRSGDEGPVDLRTHSEYAGRVEHHCERNSCTLTIIDLRKSDYAEYKFKLVTNQPTLKFIGSRGVTLYVAALQVQVTKVEKCLTYRCQYSEFWCRSSCRLPDQPSYIWYKNGEQTFSPGGYYYGEDSVSCAIKGREDLATPSMCVYGESCSKVTYTYRRICAFKGSSVDISCSYNSDSYITSKLWFSPQRGQWWPNPSQPDSQHRVQVSDTGTGRSTLRISDLTESDSAEYRFRFIAGSFKWGSTFHGTTLTVTDPDLRVQVIGSSTGPTLVCHSSCLTDSSTFIWYKNETIFRRGTSLSIRGSFDVGYHYSCAYNHHRSLPVYAPVVPAVLVSPPGDIMKDSSVSLSCSSDANPAAKYSWYKNQALVHEEPLLFFTSIQSSDSGEYYCTAENELGSRTSRYVHVDVKYGPQRASVSVSLSEIVEGSSVTLTCNSDANPAANYTWYKENQTLVQGDKGIYFKSIRSQDTGNYHCQSENQYGQINSSSFYIDVQYGPKLPSVSVSPSATEIVEGNSVTLTCSSDANPAANYTWYKENKDSPKASGQNFNITNFRAEDSGNYYCEVQNRRGNHTSQLYLTVRADAGKSAVIGTLSAVLLVLILLAVFLWFGSKKHFTQQCKGGEKPNNRAQPSMSAVDETVSAAQPVDQQDDLHYASIRLSPNDNYALYSSCGPVRPRGQAEEEDDGVEYSVIKNANASSALRSAAPPTEQREEDEEDSLALYSTVNKIK